MRKRERCLVWQQQNTQDPNPNAHTYNQPGNRPVEEGTETADGVCLGCLACLACLVCSDFARRGTVVRGRGIYLDEKGRTVA